MHSFTHYAQALAAIINCSVAKNVARRLVKDMDVLKSLVDLLWRNTSYTQFVTMLVANLAKDQDTCDNLCEMGAVHALMGLVSSPHFQKQVSERSGASDNRQARNKSHTNPFAPSSLGTEVRLHGACEPLPEHELGAREHFQGRLLRSPH